MLDTRDQSVMVMARVSSLDIHSPLGQRRANA
jgi:hypothetical protein